MKIYHWMSKDTYELQTNIFAVIKTIILNKRHYNIWTLKWKYSRKGW